MRLVRKLGLAPQHLPTQLASWYSKIERFNDQVQMVVMGETAYQWYLISNCGEGNTLWGAQVDCDPEMKPKVVVLFGTVDQSRGYRKRLALISTT